MTLGIDVGGTFTDVVSWDGVELRIAKTPSTPGDQSDGVVEGCRSIGSSKAPLLVHGTTVATNALLERSGARVVLVTDSGFTDVIEIGRQARPSLYDPMADRSAPVVEPTDRIGVASGLPALADDVGSVAVGLLGSYAEPDRENEVADEIRRTHPHLSVVTSHDVSGEFREFERLNTTVLSAYLGPLVADYLENLERRIVPEFAERVLVMRSSGGLVPPSGAARNAASILLSGPAGGVVAAAELGRSLGHRRVISFDMGGTSTDVCRIEDGVPEISYERVIDGQVCRMPSTAVHTVGAGGGSIAWVDTGGSLRVGPQSAGADPGPASYGTGGTNLTVTDANLLTGRLGMDAPLAGGLRLDASRAEAVAQRLGSDLGLAPQDLALGVMRVVDAHMERAIRTVSVEEGADPRQAVLVAFGGAGGLHAVALAQHLGMKGVVIPPAAGVFSALGLLLSRPRWDRARSVIVAENAASVVDSGLVDLRAQVADEYERAIGTRPREMSCSIDVRYLGQSHETTVAYSPGDGWAVLEDRFHRAHHERNGFSRPGTAIEAVTLRVTAAGDAELNWSDLPEPHPVGPVDVGRRAVLTPEGTVDARVVRRRGLAVGATLSGPVIVEEGEATTWIPSGCTAAIHETGAIEVSW